MIYVKHRTQCTGENDPTKQVSKDAWNEEHEIVGLGSAAAADVGDFDAAGAAGAAVASHEAANDPHPAYLKQAEGDALYAPQVHSHAIAGVTGLQAALDAKTSTAQAAAAAPVQSVAGRTGAVTLAKADVGLGNVDNTTDAAKPVSTAQQTALDAKQDTSAKGVANGYAGLDAGGKVPAAQLPAGGSDPFIAKLKLAADVSTGANVTPVNVTGMSFAFEANSSYMIDVMALMQSPAATTGCGLQIDTSVAVTAVGVTFFHQLANTGTLSGGSSIADDASLGVSSGIPSANVSVPLMGKGMLVSGANAGTAQLRLRSETTAVTTMKANSLMRVMKF